MAYLSALLALALLQLAVHPVVVGGGLLPILADAHVPVGRLARQLRLLVHEGDAVLVGDQLAGGALHPLAALLREETNMNVNLPQEVPILRSAFGAAHSRPNRSQMKDLSLR